MSKKKEWRTVQVPEGLIARVEKFLGTKQAYDLGIDSISAFITYAVRKELESKQSRFYLDYYAAIVWNLRHDEDSIITLQSEQTGIVIPFWFTMIVSLS